MILYVWVWIFVLNLHVQGGELELSPAAIIEGDISNSLPCSIDLQFQYNSFQYYVSKINNATKRGTYELIDFNDQAHQTNQLIS